MLLMMEKKVFGGRLQRVPSPFCHIYTMFFVIIGWGIFYFTDLDSLWIFIKSAFGVGVPLYDLTAYLAFFENLWLLIACIIAATPIPAIIYNHLCKKHSVFAALSQPLLVIAGLGVCFILLVGQTYNPFLYFRF